MGDFAEFNSVPLKFEVKGVPVTLKYRAAEYTGTYRQDLLALNGNTDSDAKLIADLVLEWDVIWKGEAVKLDYDSILHLPAWAISSVATALYEDLGKSVGVKWTA